ncbi:MAG: hypothetical protein PHY54_17910 [Methylococcales bacterium]|nr:hypothetical protein [Methylococcales bacterium]
MKHFDYDTHMNAILEQHGAFFAFNKAQQAEQSTPGVEYVGLQAGLVCPKDKASSLMESLAKLSANKVAFELANNSKKDIIWYELANHECQVTGSYEDIIGLLSCYGITEDDIKAEWQAYYDNCVENDYF